MGEEYDPMKTNKGVIYRNIAGEHVLIPVGSIAMDQNGMFVMTELGGQIWQMLEGGATKEEIITALLKEYEVEESRLRADVEDFLQRMIDKNLIEEWGKAREKENSANSVRGSSCCCSCLRWHFCYMEN